MIPDSSEIRIRAGWLIDGTGRPARKNVLIRASGGIITDIRDDDGRFDPDVVDLTDCTVIPGLMDAHVHLFMSGTADPEIRERQLHADYDAIRSVIAGHLDNHAANGIIAVRDGGDYGGHALRFKQETLGKGDRPVRIFAAGRAWRQSGRYGRLIGRPPENGQTLAAAITANEDGGDHVKIVQSGLNSLIHFGKQTAPQFSLSEMKEAVAAAHNRGAKVMVHANGEAPVRIAVEAGCDSIEHGFFMGTDNLKRMADRGTVWVPTAITMKSYAEMLPAGGTESKVARRTWRHQMEQIAEARHLGVRVAAGSDAGSLGVHQGLGLIQELVLLVEAGYALEEAIRCATAQTAILMNFGGYGLIKAGSPANFSAVHGAAGEILGQLLNKNTSVNEFT